MKYGSTYIHSLEGRLRIKIRMVRYAPEKALELENHLKRIDGVQEVRANPTTGNVLVLYDADKVNQFDTFSTS